MGIAAADVFATLFLLMLVVVGLRAADLPFATGATVDPSTLAVDVFVTPTSVRVGDEGPISVEYLVGRLGALGEKSSVRIRIEPDVSIEREHAVLAAAMAAGVGNVSLSIQEGKFNDHQ
jgi:biopolymer transport protein ExbD